MPWWKYLIFEFKNTMSCFIRCHAFIFLDYISINKIIQKKLKDILKGIHIGCKISNCELVGGETAEMPGTYSKGKFDIAGFCVGLVEKNKILKQKNIKEGNLILAMMVILVLLMVKLIM